MKILISFCLLFTAASISLTQEFNFRYFNNKEGITEPYIYEIDQSVDGLLWLATSNGLFNYDGLKLQKRDTTFGLSSNFIKSFCIGKNKIIAGHNDGTISAVYEDYAEKLNFKDSIFSPINQILPYGDNEFIGIIQNGGLFKVSKNDKVYYQGIQRDRIYNSIAIVGKELYVGSNEGVDIYEILPDKFKLKSKIEELDYEGVEFLLSSQKDLYIGTSEKGAYLYKNKKLIPIGQEIGIDKKKISHIHIENNSLWLTSFGEAIYQFGINGSSFNLKTKIDKYSGLKSPYVNQIFIDREGAIWIGSYGDGLIQLLDQYISNFNLSQNNKHKFTSFYMNEAQYYGGYGVIFVENISNGKSYSLDASNGVPQKEITSIFVDKNETTWIGTSNDGLYMKKPDQDKFQVVSYLDNILSRKIHHINASEQFILVSTSDGLFFLGFDGKLEQHFTTQTGLPHNKIHSTYVDDDNNVFICSNSSAVYYYNRFLKKYDFPKEIGIVDVTAVTKDMKGDIWVGTMGNGVLKKENGQFFSIDKNSGLASDFCYNILCDKDDRIWVTHRDAISSIEISTGKVNVYEKSDFDLNEIEPTSAFQSKSNVLWFGNQFGAVTLDPKQEVDLNLKPKVSLQQILLDDEYVASHEEISVGYGKHRLKFVYRGVSLRNPEKVEYQYQLENYDDDWVATTTRNFVEYNQIYDGDYVFKLRSRLKGGEWTEPVVLSRIHVASPIWKSWWFYFLIFIVLFTIVAFIIKRRERQLIASKERLERKLDERTAQIVEQKDALSRVNKDIGDSINYAKRIQSSILPPIKILEEAFDDCFILLKPKDVVSGDFYWFEKVDDKVIIVAADATGHGVPGAFMSMIGSTLMTELVRSPLVNSPQQFLGALDERINTNLNQKGRPEDSKDGMDMSVCEVSLTTNQLNYSGAYRPAWIYRDGEIIELKGNRSSIGGSMNDEKNFVGHSLQLLKGDIVYVFSDGFPDQFGGLKGKKLKSSGLRTLILRFAKRSLPEQKIEFDYFIEEWMREHEQIDDILIMGIKI